MAEKKEVDFQAYARKIKDAMGNDAGEKEAGAQEFGEKCTNYFYHKLQAAADTMKKNGYSIDEGLQFGEHTLAETMQMAGMPPENIQKMREEDKLKFAAFYAAGVEFANAKGKTTLPMYVHLPAENGKVQPQVLDDEGLKLDDLEKKGQLHSEVAVNFFEWLINLFGISTDKSRYNDQLKRSKELSSRISERLSAEHENRFQPKEKDNSADKGNLFSEHQNQLQPKERDNSADKEKLSVEEKKRLQNRGKISSLDSKNIDHIKKNKAILEAGQKEADKWNKLFFGDNVPGQWVCRDGSRLDPLSACIGIMNAETQGNLQFIFDNTPDKLREDDAAMECINSAVSKYRELADQYEEEKKAHSQKGDDGTFKVSMSLDEKLHQSLEIPKEYADTISHSMMEQRTATLYSGSVKTNDSTNKILISTYPFVNAQEQLEKVTHNPAYKSGDVTFPMISRWNAIREENELYQVLEEGNIEKIKEKLLSAMKWNMIQKSAERLQEIRYYIKSDMDYKLNKFGSEAIPDEDMKIIQKSVDRRLDQSKNLVSNKRVFDTLDSVLSGRFGEKCKAQMNPEKTKEGIDIKDFHISISGGLTLPKTKQRKIDMAQIKKDIKNEDNIIMEENEDVDEKENEITI